MHASKELMAAADEESDELMTPKESDNEDDALVTNYGYMNDGMVGTPPESTTTTTAATAQLSYLSHSILQESDAQYHYQPPQEYDLLHPSTIALLQAENRQQRHHVEDDDTLSTPKTPPPEDDAVPHMNSTPRSYQRTARSPTYASQKSMSRESLHELAKTAVAIRQTSIADVTFDHPHEPNLRESIRRVQAYSRRDAPLDYEISATVYLKKKAYEIRMDRDVIAWYRGSRLVGSIDTDDVVGADAPMRRHGCFRIHYFIKGRGKGAKALRRKYKYLDFQCDDHVATQWIQTIQELVRWQARTPPIAEKRRIKIVVNPHSGKRRARKIWFEQVKQFFDLGNFDYVIEETSYGGHAIEMGKSYSADDEFEALVFIGGDGTLCEFMNGLLSRPEHEWREIVATTPISLISAGTQNAFGTGAGIPTIEAAVYCILKRKMRPLDVITAMAEHDRDQVQYSYCGLGWGVAGDVAAESERYRWLGTSRYTYLKIKRGVLKPKKHTGVIRYVPLDPQPKVLRAYDEIRNEGAIDQFETEEGSVYDHDRLSTSRKSWGGYGGAIRSPASKRRYAEALWHEERGWYLVVGALNIAPDAAYAHPSDGNLDLIISRKGNLWRTIQLGILYLFGKELKSPLISYLKVKAVEITADQATDCMNIDGEVLSGPGPWRMEVIPSLFKALSEK